MTNDQRLVYEILERDSGLTKDEIAQKLGIGTERVGIYLAYLVSQQIVVRDSSEAPARYRRGAK
jgi:transcription initiation factor IIE alpha subunit